jgi:hypothetical protein
MIWTVVFKLISEFYFLVVGFQFAKKIWISVSKLQNISVNYTAWFENINFWMQNI